MPYERLEDLRVYQEAVIIGDEIWSEVMQWEHFEKNAVGYQLADAADSISSNIAESYGRTGTKDVVNFLIFARGSMYETKDRLSKAIRRKLIPADRGEEILKRLESLAPSLNAYISSKRRTLTERKLGSA
jgi:four helix bundle protein